MRQVQRNNDTGPSSPQCNAGGRRPDISIRNKKSQGGTSAAVTATIGELCALLGVTPAAVRELASKGIIKRLSRGSYDVATSVPAYCAHLREIASGRGGELANERARLAREQADQVAMRNRLARRELVLAVDVEREWAVTLRGVRDGILAVPSRVQQQLPHMTAGDVEIIDRELRAALTGLAEDAGSEPHQKKGQTA